MIKYRWIRWKNLNSYGNTWTQVDLDRGDTCAIVGMNGGGKSSFLDAFCFNQTGEPFRKVKKGGIVNTINEKDLMTECLLEKNGSEYLVRRGLKPNVFEIHKDGKLVNQAAKAADQQKFYEEHVLGMRTKTIRQVVILGSASFTPFMQLSAGERRLVVEDLLDISAFGAMGEIVKRLASNARSRISEARERERILQERERGKVELLKRAKATQEERVAEIESDIAQNQERISELLTWFDDTQAAIAPLTPFLKKRQTLSEAIMAGEKALVRLDAKISSTKILLSELRKPAPRCDYCNQEFPRDGVGQKIFDAEAEERTLHEQEAEVTETLNKLKAENHQLDVVIRQHGELMQTANSIRGELQLVGNQIKKLQQRLEQFKSQDHDLPAIEAEIEAVRIEIREKLLKLEEDQHILKHWNACAELLRDDGVKAKIIKTYIPLINSLVNRYLEAMDFNVSFYLDEHFEETIKSRGRDSFSYFSFSEGEKQRIDLALLFTWMEIARLKNSANTNLVVLDEIGGGSLDEAGVRDFTRLLRGLEGVSAFVISHNPHFTTALDRTLEASKVKGFSQLKERQS